MTEAVILAGGFGTRMRPLTDSMPKPLIPIAGRTLIDRILDTLPEGFHAQIAAGYLAGALKHHLTSRGNAEVVVEEKPLGTAGALWNLRHKLNGTFVVINGDLISSLNLNEILSFHAAHNARATISVWPVNNTEPYGVVSVDEQKRILKFIEKPRKGEEASNLINAGVYVLSEDIFDNMDGNSFSLEREIFPALAGDGTYAYTFGGYWFDCGTLENYLSAQEKLACVEKRGIESNTSIRGCSIHRPVWIERGTALSGSSIGPNACIYTRARVEEGCTLENVAVLQDAIVGKNCVLNGCIVSPGATVPEGTHSENKIIA